MQDHGIVVKHVKGRRKDMEIKNHFFKVCQISLTTACNGLCRYCHRNRFDTPIEHIDLSIANKLYTEKAFFSGISGDPIFYPHLFDFIERLKQNNPNIWITIATNGSIHTTKWWKKLAELISNNPFSRVYFGIDGLEDTHYIYRGTDYDKVLRNLKAFRWAGGNAIWQTIYFKYNEDQIDKIQQTAEDLGCLFILKQSRKYEPKGAFAKPADVEHRSREEMCKHSTDEPDCFLFNKDEIWINSDGTAHPCCWLSSMRPWSDIVAWRSTEPLDFKAFMLKTKSKHLINLKNNNPGDIIDTDYFKYVKKNYKNMAVCNRTCKIFWSDMVRNLPDNWNDPSTWKKSLKYDEIEKIDLGLTNRCNLKCKACPRTNLSKSLKNIDINFNLLKREFTPELLKRIKITICGSLGDTILYPKFNELMELLQDAKDVYIHTNGTMYDTKFWSNLGKLSSKSNIRIQFAVDGLNEHTYLKYRVGGNWKQLWKNIKAYTDAGGKTVFQCILFKHNEDQIPELWGLAARYNAEMKFRISHHYDNILEMPENYTRPPESQKFCFSLKNKQISIDHEGIITPCCHTRPFKMEINKRFTWFSKDFEELDLKYSTIKKAIKSDFFKLYWSKHLEQEVCQQSCFAGQRYGIQKNKIS